MLGIRRPDPCIAQCKMLYRSAVSIVNAITGMFALDRMLGGQPTWSIVTACIFAMASMTTLPQGSGADWVADMQRSVLMLIAAFILADIIMVATMGPELHQRAVRMHTEELAVARWAPQKELEG
ncbi:hypothetical protein C8Q74DRAFT_1257658 [Fomes fomentarius]|nr:hypothetical protein C8Q74DRAFT_1257658 [Fomes fomentarius]